MAQSDIYCIIKIILLLLMIRSVITHYSFHDLNLQVFKTLIDQDK